MASGLGRRPLLEGLPRTTGSVLLACWGPCEPGSRTPSSVREEVTNQVVEVLLPPSSLSTLVSSTCPTL